MAGLWTQWFQYPTLQEPVLTPAQRPENVQEDKWHYAWSDPVRVKINGRLAVALATSGLFFVGPTTGESITVDKWFALLSEPVRFKGAFRGLPTGDQLAFTTSPLPFVSFGWFGLLSEPIVKSRRALGTGSQRFSVTSPLPFVSFGWHRSQTELAPLPKRGLAARFQQFLAQPPRLLPRPTITGTIGAVEIGDSALFGGMQYARPVSAIVALPIVTGVNWPVSS